MPSKTVYNLSVVIWSNGIVCCNIHLNVLKLKSNKSPTATLKQASGHALKLYIIGSIPKYSLLSCKPELQFLGIMHALECTN